MPSRHRDADGPVLVDTSIWIDHLHRPEPHLVRLLEEGAVVIHPMVLGELALGTLRDRENVLRLLGDLPELLPATHIEARLFIEQRSAFGRGLSLVDIHLVAAALIGRAVLWTRDRRLAAFAQEAGCGWEP